MLFQEVPMLQGDTTSSPPLGIEEVRRFLGEMAACVCWGDACTKKITRSTPSKKNRVYKLVDATIYDTTSIILCTMKVVICMRLV